MLAFVGMTHLGINSAVAAAEKGFEVFCFDRDFELIERLNNHNLPFSEPNLLELLQKNRARIHFSSNFSKLSECDLVYISPDVPTNSLGQSDLSSIEELITFSKKTMNSDATIVVLSQVPPGFTRKISWKKLYYQVETLIFGQAVHRALFPERFIIGCSEPKNSLPEAYVKFLSSFQCPILPMIYESAELCKIAINMFLVSTVTTTNTIASLCEKIGADFTEIAPALKLDRRIGEFAYLNPGLGIGGGNLERDLTTFCSLSDSHGIDASVVRAWQKHSDQQSDWVLRKIYNEVMAEVNDPKFALLGLAYKKDTSSIKNSPALKLLNYLRPFSVIAFDPKVKNVPHTHAKMQFSLSAIDACKNSDVILVMTPWDEFKDIPKEIVQNKIVIDPFGLLGLHSEKYFKLGVK